MVDLLITSAVLAFLALYGGFHWIKEREDPPRRLNGWWHGLSPQAPRWTPKAWYDACQCSLQRSKERREHDYR